MASNLAGKTRFRVQRLDFTVHSFLRAAHRLSRRETRQDYETTAPMYERVLHPSVPQKKSSDCTSEENDLHYADIHVLSQMRPHSLKVKCLRSESATEYATLRFPQATPQYDSNNGTLV
ncbi:uncharacterized protein C11orf52 homolog isoform X2 [Rattus norvegicus]|uniref:uncharacterized protein C11orf52 homolog isoform X2 n=1 Tax=Rattus norvegicus TaxID=10116 RepID=UPI0019179370|nr:uncharacterized protein C11orf52 homolog isoform X2 [Rattus norvegicus]